jgi:Nif-specific regulatory protein
MLAYLVIREGTKWSNVFRLTPGHTVTVGRAPTNHIVLKDEQCSRHHAEIFMTDGHWTVRDLDSRNGTLVGDDRVRGDRVIEHGDVIRIAHTQFAIVDDLAQAFPDSSSVVRNLPQGNDEVTSPGTETVLVEAHEPTTITHRRGQTRFLEPDQEHDDIAVPRVGRAATKLCRLAFELAKQTDLTSVARLALDGLLEGTNADAGAVLLIPRGAEGPHDGSDLEIIASRSDNKPSYHRVSRFLAGTVWREGEAVLARNVVGDSTLGIRDSKGEFQATSVICAPVRQDSEVVGLVHLYATDEERVLDPDDLEFTLAVAENVALALKNLSRQQELAEHLSLSKNEIIQLRKRLGAESEIIGNSPQLAQIHQQIAKVGASRATVLIRGESGVGKELVARAMHFASPRKKGPFVCLNCAALSETLLESELFGHERGAFTGATERKIGKFESAHQGTLMLDEIGEMSPSIQAKFLRVLEGHPFERVGGSQAIKADVRVIAATNRDLEKAVREGKFRRDLYFRLNVVDIFVPPLRKRPDDVAELAQHFLQRFNAETGRRIRGFTPEAMRLLRQYRWPGNVRELKNVVERAVVLARSEFIGADDLILSNLATTGESGEVPPPQSVFELTSLADMEARHVLATLQEVGWNKSRAAQVLGIERSTLDRKIRRYDLRPSPASHIG